MEPESQAGAADAVRTYDDAVRYLYGLRLHGLKLGLENIRRLAELAGHPEARLRFIHVAGTNGKGSTCAMLESVYRAAGLRVGLFTSPHLVSFRERIQVDRRPIPPAAVIELVRTSRGWLAQCPEEHPPTFFEVVTAIALLYFARERCDLVIWETGMGGRLDATNLVTPLASVITNVQLDHERWLGATRAAIAQEKAGIIKPGVPVLTGAEAPEVLEVIRQVATARGAPLSVVPAVAAEDPFLRSLRLPLLGAHQRLNAALAMAVVQRLEAAIPVAPAQVRHGLEHVQWPGRLQLVTTHGGGRILLDGAHNPAGVKALHEVLTGEFGGHPITLVLGILQDKDWRHMCETLAPLASRILIVPVKSERTAAPTELASVCQAIRPEAKVHAVAGVAEALDAARHDPLVVVTGSLFLVGEALELLGEVPPDLASERGLNEWGGGAL